MNFRDLSRNCLARGQGAVRRPRGGRRRRDHAGDRRRGAGADRREVRSAAATSSTSRRRWRTDAPVLHDDLFTAGVEPKPTKPSNIAKKVTFKKGDIEAGFKDAEVIVEGRYTTAAGAPGLYRAACLPVLVQCRRPGARSTAPARAISWSAPICAKLLGIDISNIRAMPAEIGGGFGGKTLVYLEPVAIALSKKCGRPVKMQMTREEVFRASGPTSGATDGSEARRQEGRHHRRGAAGAEVPGRRVPRLADRPGLHVRLRDVRHPERRCRRLRRGEQPAEGGGLPRARRADLVVRGRERDGRPGAQAGHGPDRRCARRTAARNGTKTHYGPTHQNIGFLATLEAAKTTRTGSRR